MNQIHRRRWLVINYLINHIYSTTTVYLTISLLCYCLHPESVFAWCSHDYFFPQSLFHFYGLRFTFVAFVSLSWFPLVLLILRLFLFTFSGFVSHLWDSVHFLGFRFTFWGYRCTFVAFISLSKRSFQFLGLSFHFFWLSLHFICFLFTFFAFDSLFVISFHFICFRFTLFAFDSLSCLHAEHTRRALEDWLPRSLWVRAQ
jgi:hypothetical protein